MNEKINSINNICVMCVAAKFNCFVSDSSRKKRSQIYFFVPEVSKRKTAAAVLIGDYKGTVSESWLCVRSTAENCTTGLKIGNRYFKQISEDIITIVFLDIN